jgi:hypothetical protein
MPVQSRDHNKYWITFICDYLDFWCVDYLKKKSDALDSFKRFVAYAETHHGVRVVFWRQDKGGEFIGHEVSKFLGEKGIQREDTEPDEPHQNGTAERANRTIAEGATTLLAESKLPNTFWEDAARYYVTVRNMCPSQRSPKISPYQGWNNGALPDASRVRVFGCSAWVLIRSKHRQALQVHSENCIFIGFKPNSVAYLFWNPHTQRTVTSSHVKFDEGHFPGNRATPFENPFAKLNWSTPLEHSKAPSVPLLKPSATTLVQFPTTPAVLDRGGDYEHNDPSPANESVNIHDSQNPEALEPACSSPMPPDTPETAPSSPILPTVSTPQTSPIPNVIDLPPLSPTESESPTKPSLPPQNSRLTKQLALHEPQIGQNGLIIPIPNTGRGFRRNTQNPIPWGWNGPHPRIQESQSAQDVIFDDPVIPELYATGKLNNEDILNGIRFVADTLPIGFSYQYLSLEEAMNLAMELRSESASIAESEPRTLTEALKRPSDEARKWYDAAVDEINSLVDHEVFELVSRPNDRTPIGSRWVFKVKRNSDGSIDRYKARLVAKGYSMRPGFDFNETFSPTPKWAALRAILALAALEDMILWSIDISTAFLNGKLQETVYMEQPEGFQQKGKDWVWKLKRTLYGLKQSGREWHLELNRVLTTQLGFQRVRCDHSVWVFGRHSDETRIIVPVFVDDITIATKSDAARISLINDLRKHFKLRDEGPTKWLLGVEISRDRPNHTLTINQAQFTRDILKKAGMENCKSIDTPMSPGTRLSKDQCPQTKEEESEMKSVPYRELLGAIAYLAIATRPDIAYTVSVLARFSHNPGRAHWTALKHLLRYLQGTIGCGISYAPDPDSSDELFSSFTDSDHAGNPDNMRSTSGFVIKMGTGAISWASRLQPFVTLSTTEAEYVAAVTTGQEILWLRNLLSELGYKVTTSSRLRMDNQSALAVAKNPDHHGRVKHLDLRFYWLRDEVERGSISVEYLQTNDMPADLFTKALTRDKVQHFCYMIGIHNCLVLID